MLSTTTPAPVPNPNPSKGYSIKYTPLASLGPFAPLTTYNMLRNTPPFEAWIFHPCGWVHCGTNTEREWKLHPKASALTCPSKVLASLLWSSRYHQSNAFNTPFRKESLFNQFNLYIDYITGSTDLRSSRTHCTPNPVWSCLELLWQLWAAPVWCPSCHHSPLELDALGGRRPWSQAGRRMNGYDLHCLHLFSLHNDLIWYEYSYVIYMYIWVMWVIFKQFLQRNYFNGRTEWLWPGLLLRKGRTCTRIGSHCLSQATRTQQISNQVCSGNQNLQEQ